MQEELLNKYLESLQQRITRIASLQEKLEEGNARAVENIRLLAHSLHGSGGSFGFPRISEAANLVEHAETDDIKARLAELKQVLEAVLAEHKPTPVREKPKKSDTRPQDPPAAPKQEPSTAASPKKPAAASQTRILVVDDDPVMSEQIANALKSLPGKSEVTVVASAASAQAAVVNQEYDLIIMDLVLPDRDGRELIQEIRLEFQIVSPLLVLSAIHNDAVRVKCIVSFPSSAQLVNGNFCCC